MTQHYSVDQVAAAFAVDVGTLTYLGTGSFGETWRVDVQPTAAGTGGSVSAALAAKIIHRDGYSQERLDREVQGLRRVDHPGVVKLRGVRAVTIDGADRPVLDFDFIDGLDVEDALGSRPPSTDETLRFAQAACDALQALHAADVVHRDIKGPNVSLRGGAWTDPVLLDLGLVRLLDATSYTQYPAHVGTPLCMAPEQVRGERARKAADLWALGVLLYRMLTGSHPFIADGEIVDAATLLTRMDAGPAALPAEVPEPLLSVVPALLSAQQHKRMTAAHMAQKLRA